MENEIDLPRRERVQFFITETRTMQEDDLNLFYIEDEEKIILGYEYCIETGKKIVFYIAPMEDNKALLFVCVDKEGNLDGFLENMTDVEYKYKKRTWPKFFVFVDNLLNQRFHTPCLFPFEINKNNVFCVGRELENISPSDYDSEYVIKNAAEIIGQTMEALHELGEKEMSMSDTIGMTTESIFATVMPAFRAQRISDFISSIL